MFIKGEEPGKQYKKFIRSKQKRLRSYFWDQEYFLSPHH